MFLSRRRGGEEEDELTGRDRGMKGERVDERFVRPLLNELENTIELLLTVEIAVRAP